MDLMPNDEYGGADAGPDYEWSGSEGFAEAREAARDDPAAVAAIMQFYDAAGALRDDPNDGGPESDRKWREGAALRIFAREFAPDRLPRGVRQVARRFHAEVARGLLSLGHCCSCFGPTVAVPGTATHRFRLCDACLAAWPPSPPSWWLAGSLAFVKGETDAGLPRPVADLLRAGEPAALVTPARPAPVLRDGRWRLPTGYVTRDTGRPVSWSWGPVDDGERTAEGNAGTLGYLLPHETPPGVVTEDIGLDRLSAVWTGYLGRAGYPAGWAAWREEWHRNHPDFPASCDPWVWVSTMRCYVLGIESIEEIAA